jgi:negative regulator of sigma-B (phosphoserine phosphatase)
MMENQFIDWSAAMLALEGETISGDMYLIRPFPNGVLVAAVDGLGHGPEAAASAQVAISTLEANADQPVVSLVRSCHQALKGMRGVVMSLASFNKTENTLTWLAVGNVEGRLFRANQAPPFAREILLLRGGIVGSNLPSLIAVTVPISAGDVLIFASDGIRNDFAENLYVNIPPQQLASDILTRSAKNTDDALVVVARYL